MVRGWAVSDEDGICVASVCPDKIGAIVNWVWIAKAIRVLSTVSDDEVLALWKEHASPTVRLVEICIEERQ
jgi:hypothetical protein